MRHALSAIRTLAGAAVLVTAVLAGTAPAQAAGTGALGIGHQVTPRLDTGIYSGPGLSTPRIGTAWAGDNVAAICQVTDNNGKRMVLGIDRPGRNGLQWANTAGYLWADDVNAGPITLRSCGDYGRSQDLGKPLHLLADTGLYSGPGLGTPRIGTAWAGHEIAGICKIRDSNGMWMALGIDRPGRDGVQWADTAGYLWAEDVQELVTILPDCGAS
jgi:hypothetical protein